METTPGDTERDHVRLVDQNAVLVANPVNVSIIKPHWLTRNNILTEDEVSGDIVIAPGVARIPTGKFLLQVLPDRIQMSFTPSQTTDRSNDLERVVGGIAKSLPHTPYSAIGLNFIFLVQLPNGKSFQKWNRSLFASPYSSSVVPLEAQNARFGSYCSMDIFGTRLKLDVKPVKVNEGQSQQNPIFKPDEEAVMLNFNYHVDLQQPDSIVQIMNCIAVWGKALDKSIEIAASTLARIEKSE